MSLKRILSLAALTVLLAGLTYAGQARRSPAMADDNLTCKAVQCGSNASCGEPGKENSCSLTCESGSTVTCTPKEE